MIRTICALVLCGLVCLAAFGCGAGDSPQGVFERFKAAQKSGDMVASMRCVEPKAQKSMAQMALMPLMMIQMAGGEVPEADKAKIDELKNGLKGAGVNLEGKDADEMLANVKDYPSVMQVYVDWAKKHNPESLDKMKEGKGGEAVLKDVKIEGDKATGKMEITEDGKTKTEDANFVKVDGKWYLAFGE